MELKVKSRQAGKKSNLKSIRREGQIPAVVYSRGQKGKELVLDGGEFKKFLNKITPGTLSTCIFTLEENGKKVRAIIKDIQYNIVTYDVIHLDFVELIDDVPVSINIPIQCTGLMDCVGVKLGGSLRQLLRYVKVSCLPKDILSHVEVDVKDLGVNEVRRLRDISLPASVRPLMDLKEIAVAVSKR